MDSSLDAEVEEALSALTLKARPAHLSTDDIAGRIRDAIDYSKKITEVCSFRLCCREREA